MVDKSTLLKYLPPYQHGEEIITDDQDVEDIMDEIADAHKYFACDYDTIYQFFNNSSLLTVCRSLFDFCKRNIPYKVESEEDQTTRSPSAILVLGNGDCKHYACFIGGVLSAIVRNTGRKINWCYRYGNYDLLSSVPGHVFVVVKDGGSEYWIDPVLGKFNQRVQPYNYIDEKINEKEMLRRISGVVDSTASIDALLDNPIIGDELKSIDLSLPAAPPALHDAVIVLMNYGVMNQLGQVDVDKIGQYIATLPNDQVSELLGAINTIQAIGESGTVIGGWLSDAFKGIQHFAAGMGMQVPRAAFLGLIAVNGLGYATKLNRALQFEDTKAKLADLWERVGGTFSVLEKTIISGAKKKALLKGIEGAAIGIEPATGTAAVIGSAAIIIAAIMPVISKLLDKKNANIDTGIQYDPNTGLPYGYSSSGATGIIAWIQQNLVLVAGGVLLLGYYFSTNKKRA